MRLLYEQLNGRDAHEAGLALVEKLCGGPLPEICRTKLGKPYFADSPLHFSISHTKNYVFAAISENPIGIDAEELDRNIDLRLAEKLLSANEFTQFEKATDQRLALLRFWVLKEAAGKCTGEGMQLWPNCTDFSLNDPRLQEISGCLVAVMEEKASP